MEVVTGGQEDARTDDTLLDGQEDPLPSGLLDPLDDSVLQLSGAQVSKYAQ